MDNSTIGIKIADGTYYPVIVGESKKKKKLVLTTVNDDQDSVQIDLYKGAGLELNDARYIGSLVIEDIMPAMKGTPDIELVIGVDEEGNMNAVAGDIGSDERQTLSVSLESLGDNDFGEPDFELNNSFDDDFDDSGPEDSVQDDEAVFDDIPSLDDEESILEDSFEDAGFEDASFEDDDFGDEAVFDDVPEMDDDEGFGDSDFDDGMPDGDFGDSSSFDAFSSGTGTDEEQEPEEDSYAGTDNKRKRSSFALIVLLILILAIAGLGAFLIIRSLNGEGIPPLEAESAPPAVQAAEPVAEPAHTEPPAAEPEITAAAEPAVPTVVKAPEAEPARTSTAAGMPAAGHGGGVWYRLKWGDTLWDLSNSFYRTPWLYGLIAVENGIKNPDLIYAGTDIVIPEN